MSLNADATPTERPRRELTSIALDLVVEPEQMADEAIAWLLDQEPAMAAMPPDYRLALRVVAIKTVHLMQDLVREIATGLDKVGAEVAERGRGAVFKEMINTDPEGFRQTGLDIMRAEHRRRRATAMEDTAALAVHPDDTTEATP